MQQALLRTKISISNIYTWFYLNGGEDGSNIVSRAPTALQNVKTEATIVVDVGMEHFAYKLDYG